MLLFRRSKKLRSVSHSPSLSLSLYLPQEVMRNERVLPATHPMTRAVRRVGAVSLERSFRTLSTIDLARAGAGFVDAVWGSGAGAPAGVCPSVTHLRMAKEGTPKPARRRPLGQRSRPPILLGNPIKHRNASPKDSTRSK